MYFNCNSNGESGFIYFCNYIRYSCSKYAKKSAVFTYVKIIK